jgi:hypothetical protein
MKEVFMEILSWWLDWWIGNPIKNFAITLAFIGFIMFSVYAGMN